MQTSWKVTEGGLLSPAIDYSLGVTSNLAGFETRVVNNRPGLDYDSAYYYQRDVSEILHDIFLNRGQLVNPGRDFDASQSVGLSTLPRLPAFFGLEKLFRPVFSYHVDYRWKDDQTDLQNGRHSAWNNTITTGIEVNVRDLGTMIFGKAGEAGVTRGARQERGRHTEVGEPPEQVPQPGSETRETPVPNPRNETRNQVDRGSEFRPQTRPNPLGQTPNLLDTLKRPGSTASSDTGKRIHTPGVGTGGLRDPEYVSDTTLTPMAPPDEPELAEE